MSETFCILSPNFRFYRTASHNLSLKVRLMFLHTSIHLYICNAPQ